MGASPHATEGDLSRLRSRVVSREPLAEVAAELSLGDALQLGSGELKSGGFRRQSILADALEAVFGAIYLDGGLEAAAAVIVRLFASRIAALPEAGDAQGCEDPPAGVPAVAQPRPAALRCDSTSRARTTRRPSR